LTTQMVRMGMKQAAQMLKTCTIPPSVRLPHDLCILIILIVLLAKKEDDPEQALKEFRAIVDKEEEKGDWYFYLFTVC
jgi:hypothetical protein